MQKKRVFFHSNYCGAKTGFGGFMREILGYLHATDKYELYLYAAGITKNYPEIGRWPWKVIGSLPDNPQELHTINQDPGLARAVGYGDYLIDSVMSEIKPDIYIGVEDPWGIDFCRKKFWWNKIPCVVHTTIDSRPLLPMAIDLANGTPHYYCWADFATQEFHKMGLKHVKTLRGSVDTNVFRRLPTGERINLRDHHAIPQNAYCIGMLSRNQLRKGFLNLLEGFKQFKDENPDVKNPRLLLFTHFAEPQGWNIPKWIKHFNIPPEEVLATYKCRATGEFFILPYTGQDINNPRTGNVRSMVTVNIKDGLTEEQVNEWYNLLDVYAHPFTSGGQERSIQEAKLTELVTLVTNYSCGEDSCVPEAASLPLEYHKYWEKETEFFKATTDARSISKQLFKVYKMDKRTVTEMGKRARQWVLNNFSIEIIGKQFEEIIDAVPYTTFDFEAQASLKNPSAEIPNIANNRDWVRYLYKAILDMDVSDEDDGLQGWLKKLDMRHPRQDIEDYFRKVAREENAKHTKIDVDELFTGKEPPEERVLINMPESLGDCLYLTALLKDARELYHDKKIYIATLPQYREIFEPLVGDVIDYVIDWHPPFDNSMVMEGYGDNVGYAHIVLQPHFATQRMISYLHHGEDRSKINLQYSE